MTIYEPIRPQKNVLYGLTHTEAGLPIIREPKLIKVSIGLPKGRAIYAYTQEGKWVVRTGYKEGSVTTKAFPTREHAQLYFEAELPKAPICPYPRDNKFFLFTRKRLMPDGTDFQEPAWDVIDACGDRPTSVSVVFLTDDAFSGGYAMWSASELKCQGDGITALRVLALASTPEEKQLAAEAKARDEKFFPIVNGCWTKGCPYSKPTFKGDKEYPSACKPGLDLKFQIAKAVRIGGTAYFHSSSIRSITQTFSAIETIKMITRGRIAGIPLLMNVAAYKTNHGGKPGKKYGISFEFRAEDMAGIQQAMLKQAMNFGELGPAPPKLIESSDEVSPMTASDMEAEFYPEASEDDETEQDAKPVTVAETATASKTEELVAKLTAVAGKNEIQLTTKDEASVVNVNTTSGGETADAVASTGGEIPPDASKKRRPLF